MIYLKANLRDIVFNNDFEEFVKKLDVSVDIVYSNDIYGEKSLKLSDIVLMSQNNSKIKELFCDVEIEIPLCQLSKYPKLLTHLIKNEMNVKSMFSNINNVISVARVNKQIKSIDIDNMINDNIVETMEKYGSFCYAKIPVLLKEIQNVLRPSVKSKIVKYFILNKDLFASQYKKQMINIISEFLSSYDDRVSFLKSFHRSIKVDTFDKIVSEVPNKIDDKNIKNILNKDKKLSAYYKFNKDDLKNDKKREALIKYIIKTPTATNNLNFKVDIELDDFKKVAPMMRFKFLEWYYSDIFNQIGAYGRFHHYYRPIDRYTLNKSKKTLNIQLEPISPDQIKQLLFSVSLKKNARTTRWFEKYKIYYRYINGTETPSRQEISKVWSI